MKAVDLDSTYYTKHLITYLGNKRRLLYFINSVVSEVSQKIGRPMVCMDGFSGSGVVSRLLKNYASLLVSNDIEEYATTVNSAYLSNKSEVDVDAVKEAIDFLNAHKHDETDSSYFITKNYAPADDENILLGERVFYTHTNAKIIDNVRAMINQIKDPVIKQYCLAALIIQASIHNNTSGVFKGFHKKDGIGHFGGKGENALTRIKGEIRLQYPVFSDAECDVQVTEQDINEYWQNTTQEFDLVYYDPPYNQHPYGSNYFMLNIINNGVDIEIQDGVSGIAKDWKKSEYNYKKKAEEAMDNLIAHTRSKYILLSYNNEGIIPQERMHEIVSSYGTVELKTQDYNTYRGSRNLSDRKLHVKEQLWLIEKH